MSKKKRAEKLIGKTIQLPSSAPWHTPPCKVLAVGIDFPFRNERWDEPDAFYDGKFKKELCLKLSFSEGTFFWMKVNSRVHYVILK